MTHDNQITIDQDPMQLILEHGMDGIRPALETLFNMAMQVERSNHLNARPYERNEERIGHANGFKDKKLNTRVGTLDLRIPQTRGTGTPFYPQALERGQRSEQALVIALATMYINGVSTRKVTKILEEMCGTEVSSSMVSRASATLDDQLSAWRERPLGEVLYLQLDARYEKVRVNGVSRSCAVLVATGVPPDGKRTVLGISVSLSEAEVHWRDFLRSLKERGMHGMKIITSDSHEGLKAALKATFSGIPWQRCQFHLQQNASSHVPTVSARPQVADRIRSIFNADDLNEAETKLAALVAEHQESTPRLADWLEQNIPEGLTVFSLPKSHQKRLRTTNMVERINQELKRRTRVVGIFPNEESLLRLVSAITMEISDEWEAAKRYLIISSE